MQEIKFDEIGYWSEIKLEIIERYATEYSKILNASTEPAFHHVYIDAFSGPGEHISRETGETVLGSPLIALGIDPPFKKYYYIDIESDKVDYLREAIGDRDDVKTYVGDCNNILIDEVFPEIKYENFCRGLCLLDPYGLHLSWKVIQRAGHSKTIEIFLNFPVMDMNRNVLWKKNIDGITELHIERMNTFWGDNSWQGSIFRPSPQLNIFGTVEKEKVMDNVQVAEAFRKRLEGVANFKYVPNPIPMRNSIGATVYYLFFASQNRVGAGIVNHIFDMYRDKGSRL